MKVIDAMNQDSGMPLTSLKVDGGMTSNNLLMQLQADLVGIDVGMCVRCSHSYAVVFSHPNVNFKNYFYYFSFYKKLKSSLEGYWSRQSLVKESCKSTELKR